jgi:hypothetical protein
MQYFGHFHRHERMPLLEISEEEFMLLQADLDVIKKNVTSIV